MTVGSYMKHILDDPRLSCSQWNDSPIPQKLLFLGCAVAYTLLWWKTKFLISVLNLAGMDLVNPLIQ